MKIKNKNWKGKENVERGTLNKWKLKIRIKMKIENTCVLLRDWKLKMKIKNF
jgi:hypothetical protein